MLKFKAHKFELFKFEVHNSKLLKCKDLKLQQLKFRLLKFEVLKLHLHILRYISSNSLSLRISYKNSNFSTLFSFAFFFRWKVINQKESRAKMKKPSMSRVKQKNVKKKWNLLRAREFQWNFSTFAETKCKHCLSTHAL